MSLINRIAEGLLLLFPFHAAAWKAAAEPIRRAINIQDERTKSRQLESWRKSMQDQLTTVGITVRTPEQIRKPIC